MRKRGQMTIFVALGIVVLAVIAILFFFRGEITDALEDIAVLQSMEAREAEDDIRNHAEACLAKITAEGLQRVLAQGGYYADVPRAISYSVYSIPYYLYNGEENVPSLETIALSLAFYVEDNLNRCVESYPRKINAGSPEVAITFSDNIRAEARHVLVHNTDEFSVRIKGFSAEANADMRGIYSEAVAFFNEVKNLSDTDFAAQGAQALEGEFKFYTPIIDERGMMFMLTFEDALAGKNLDYNFAVKYKEAELNMLDDFESLFAVYEDEEVDGIDVDSPSSIAAMFEDIGEAENAVA